MYKPDPRTKINFFVLFIFASVIAWIIYVYYKPVVLDRACSSYAQKAVDKSISKSIDQDCQCSYDEIKNDCLSTTSTEQ